MLNIRTSSNILVVVAHPDDEFWGLGGTLLRIKEENPDWNCWIVIVSNGERGDNTGKLRINQSNMLATELGAKFYCLDVPANKLPINYSDIILKLDSFIYKVRPDVVFTHYDKDTHQDHVTTYNAVQGALRNRKKASLLQIETPFKVDFMPNFYVDITFKMNSKQQLYERYFQIEIKQREEFQIKYLTLVNRFRGIESGNIYAEGFILKKGMI
jgi:LmbE family N-acetylglucosaminyl deacetylase